MHIKDVRLARLHVLLAEHGNNKAALARTLGKAPAQVSQWFNGVRTITEESARSIEIAAKRPRGWMDTEIYSTSQGATELIARDGDRTLAITPEERDLILRIREMNRKH